MNAFAAMLLCVGLASCAAMGKRLTDGEKSDVEALESDVQQRAARLLGSGERLAVEITDLDRAGRTEPWRPGLGNVRVMRDVYPARIELTFRLTDADDVALKQGERTLSEPLPVAAAAPYGEDPLRYEKALLDNWLERELRR